MSDSEAVQIVEPVHLRFVSFVVVNGLCFARDQMTRRAHETESTAKTTVGCPIVDHRVHPRKHSGVVPVLLPQQDTVENFSFKANLVLCTSFDGSTYGPRFGRKRLTIEAEHRCGKTPRDRCATAGCNMSDSFKQTFNATNADVEGLRRVFRNRAVCKCDPCVGTRLVLSELTICLYKRMFWCRKPWRHQ